MEVRQIFGGFNLSFAIKDSQFDNFDIPNGAILHSEEEHHDEDEHHDEETWGEVGTGHLKVKLSNANYGNIDAIAFSAKGTPIGDLIMNHSGGLLHLQLYSFQNERG